MHNMTPPHKGAAVLNRTKMAYLAQKYKDKIRNPQPTVPTPSEADFNILVIGAVYKL